MEQKASNPWLTTGMIGAGIAVLCCATPVLAILLGVVGFGALTGYIDYVALPALAGFIGIIGYGLYRKQQCAHEEPVER